MKRFELLLDQDVLDELDRIAAEVGVNRSFLIRKAIRLYIDSRSPKLRKGQPPLKHRFPHPSWRRKPKRLPSPSAPVARRPSLPSRPASRKPRHPLRRLRRPSLRR